jgi:serine/threonine protein kinase
LALGSESPPAASDSGRGARVGRRFGDYQLLDLIGRGGMGVVYRAHQFSLNQDVALKMILDGRESSARAMRWFHFEAEVAARLRHPNIVRIYHVGEQDGDPFFTMELIGGASLSRRMAKGEFRPQENHQTKTAWNQTQIRIAQLTMTMARAVHYAHEQGVLHRDIKPGNIIIDQKGEPHLTDFGLAKLADASTLFSDSGSIAGTPAYMSPEQARGDRLTPAADTYSLGVILYELLRGRPPFQGATPVETLRQILEQEPANPAVGGSAPVDTDLATICLKCLQKSPSARYATTGDLADDLDRWLRHEPIRARPVNSSIRLRRWIRRNPVGASFIGALVLGMITTSGLIVRLTRAQEEAVILRKEAQHEKEVAQQRAAAARHGFQASIQRLWSNTNHQYEFITSEELSAFLPTPKPEADYEAPFTRVNIGISVTETPIKQAERYARPLAQLEEQMSIILGHRVLLDLKLFKFKTGKIAELMAGDVDFAAVGPYAYVRAKALEPGLTPIARDDLPKPAVFFTRRDSRITNMSQFVGKSLALGDEGATISLWAKVELARAGIFGTNLSWEHYDGQSDFLRRMYQGALHNATEKHSHSHAAAIEAVTNGLADIGVARRDYVQDFTKRRFRIIHSFESTPQLWVASADAAKEKPDVMNAFRQALIQSETIIISYGPDHGIVTRLLPVDDVFFDKLRQAITNEVHAFEGNRPVQSILGESFSGDDE